MCGIFGCVGKIDYDMATMCVEEIHHRGPDSMEIHQMKGITLGHTRLSILDMSDAANQPMSDITGRFWIVYNGEVYNYLELRMELETLGYHFKTNSDTEVILYAYIAWGEEFQYKCNGMWALAIWDSYCRNLFLSRDRFGVKPLYYFIQDGNFYFASEMKAFFPIMHERKINYSVFAIKDYLSFESTENCSIRGIKKVLAGHCGYIEEKNIRFHKWWEPLEHIIDVPEKYEEQVEMLRSLFLNACKIRMRSDVPIGTALSGGVDSSAVIGAMSYCSSRCEKYINKDWQHAFVACMQGTSIDETIHAQKAAEYVGLDINKVMVNAKISAEKLFEYMYICEDPYITSPIPFFQTYGSIANSGIKVTLDGHGADELFGGYSFDLIYSSMEYDADNDEKREIWRTFNEMIFPESRVTYDKFQNMLSNCAGSHKDVYAKDKPLGMLNSRLYRQTYELTLPTLLRCYDRYSMGKGVEIRMPFMDYRIVCFAFSIPWRSKIYKGYSKRIVRDMSAAFMDKDIVYRKLKIGFNSPLTEWFQGEMKEFVLDSVYSKDFYECELINPLHARIIVDNFYSSDKSSFGDGQAVWRELMPYLWKKAMKL